jgi:hypothetical protein
MREWKGSVMAKYRKTALIEAKQWHKMGDHPAVVTNHYLADGEWEPAPELKTLEGWLSVKPGDWIAGPGAKGEYWPIDDEVFRATYELVDVV